jgi:hypothetical protein
MASKALGYCHTFLRDEAEMLGIGRLVMRHDEICGSSFGFEFFGLRFQP